MSIKVARKKTARLLAEQQVHYLYRSISANAGSADIGVVTTQSSAAYVGVLPANCMPMKCIVRVKTTFDQLFNIGTTVAAGSSASFATTFDMVVSTTGTREIDRCYGNVQTTDTPVYVFTAPTAPTTGTADIWITYLPAQ